jgi:hypothetical protein
VFKKAALKSAIEDNVTFFYLTPAALHPILSQSSNQLTPQKQVKELRVKSHGVVDS